MIAVIGIGSPNTADQLGWHVIDCLQQTGIDKSGSGQTVELSKLDRPGSAVIEHLQTANMAILIDAIINKQLANKEIVTLSADELLQHAEQEQTPVSSHGFGLLQAVKLAKSLDLLPGKTNLVGLNIIADNNSEMIGDREIKLLADTVVTLIKDN